jgi:hypothetical protein
MDITYDKYKFLIKRERELVCILVCLDVCAHICVDEIENVREETCHQDRAWNRHIR